MNFFLRFHGTQYDFCGASVENKIARYWDYSSLIIQVYSVLSIQFWDSE